MTELRENERLDDLGRRGYRLIQNRDSFCFGVDAVLLAWYAKAGKRARVLDLCTGNGIVPILMDARQEENSGVTFTGIEIQDISFDLAVRSASLNGISDRICFLQGDIRGIQELVPRGSFDVVTANPPYMKAGSAIVNPEDRLAAARHEVLCTLEDTVRAAAWAIRSGGRFYMIHRPRRLSEIFDVLKTAGFSIADLTFVHPYADREATMVLVTAVKDGRTETKISRPVVIYEKENVYSELIGEIYGDGRH